MTIQTAVPRMTGPLPRTPWDHPRHPGAYRPSRTMDLLMGLGGRLPVGTLTVITPDGAQHRLTSPATACNCARRAAKRRGGLARRARVDN